MNPWGFMVILFGAVVAWVGIRGTQGTLYSDIFGHPYVPGPHGIASAGNNSQNNLPQLPGFLTPLAPGLNNIIIPGATNVVRA